MVVKGGYRKIMVKWSEKTISRNENKIPKNITKNWHNGYEVVSARRTERGSKNSAKIGKCDDG